MAEISEQMRQQLTAVAREEGYTEDQIKNMLESGDLVFGGLI